MFPKIIIFVITVAAGDSSPVWKNENNFEPGVFLRIGRSPNMAYGYISGLNSNNGNPSTSFGSSYQPGISQAYGTSAGSHNGGVFVRRAGIVSAPSSYFIPYQQSHAAVFNEDFRRLESAPSSNYFGPNYGAMPSGNIYKGFKFDDGATFFENRELPSYPSLFLPKNKKGLGTNIVAVSTGHGLGYGAAVSSSSDIGNRFGSAVSSSYNDRTNYKSDLLANGNNGRIRGNTGQAVRHLAGSSTTSAQNGGTVQNLKGYGSSVAAVSSNNGDGYRSVAFAQSLNGGLTSAASTTHNIDGLKYGAGVQDIISNVGSRGNTVQIIQQRAPINKYFDRGFASAISTTRDQGLNNGYRVVISSNNLSAVPSTDNSHGIKYKTTGLDAKNNSVNRNSSGPVISQKDKSVAQNHNRVNFGTATINESQAYNPLRYGSSLAAVSSTNGVGYKPAKSTAHHRPSGHGVAVSSSTSSTRNGAGYKAAQPNSNKTISGLGSAVSGTISTDGANYKSTLLNADKNSGVRAQVIQQTAGSVHSEASIINRPGFQAAQSSSVNMKY